MVFLIIILVVLAFFLVAVIVGVVKGAKRVHKTNTLQKVADLSFKRTNGTHVFNYAIKKFGSETGKRIKIIIVAETNFSDYGSNVVYENQAKEANVFLEGMVSGNKCSSHHDLNSLQPTITVDIPDNLSNEKLKVKVDSNWIFGDNSLFESFEFELE